MAFQPLEQLLRPERFESPAILKKLASASRKLAEFKGMGATIPNQNILTYQYPALDASIGNQIGSACSGMGYNLRVRYSSGQGSVYVESSGS